MSWTRWLVVPLLAASMALAACGDDDESATAGGGGAQQSDTTSVEAPPTSPRTEIAVTARAAITVVDGNRSAPP